jgi:hypothetical protein
LHWHAGSPYCVPTSTSPCLPSSSWLAPVYIPTNVELPPSLVPAANVVQIQATLAPSRTTCATMGCKLTRIRRDCGRRSCKAHCLEAGARGSPCPSPAHHGSTMEIVHHNYPLLAPALPPIALPSMTGLAPPSNMFIMPPPPIQLQINPTLQATVSQVSSTLPPSSSLDACANPQFASHMSSIFMEQWAAQQRLQEEQRK